MSDINAMAGVRIGVKDVRCNPSQLCHAIDRNGDGSTPAIIDLDALELGIGSFQFRPMIGRNDIPLIAEVPEAVAKKQSFICTQSKILEQEIRITDREVVRIDRIKLILRQRSEEGTGATRGIAISPGS